jgi:hypothetical protein
VNVDDREHDQAEMHCIFVYVGMDKLIQRSAAVDLVVP